MLIVVGLPGGDGRAVLADIAQKKRLAENFSAMIKVAPRLTIVSAPRSCAEAQEKGRKSYSRSSAVMPKPSATGSMFNRYSRKFQDHALRPGARSGGEQDHRIVVGARRARGGCG